MFGDKSKPLAKACKYILTKRKDDLGEKREKKFCWLKDSFSLVWSSFAI